MDELRFNTAIAKLIELTNALTTLPARVPRGGRAAGADDVAVGPAPGRGAVAQLGHDGTLAYADFPVADPALLVAESITYPVQVNGKVRGRVEVAPDTAEDAVRAAALAEVAEALAGRDPKKVIVVPGRLVSVVV